MERNFAVHRKAREIVHHLVKDLSDDELQKIPAGFPNNILWQWGHLLVTQQLLTRARAGQALLVSDSLVAQCRKGTSPADWMAPPDRKELEALHHDLVERTRGDLQAGRLTNYEAYVTGSGFQIASAEDAIAFNNFHEGTHAGLILALKRAVRR